MVLAEKEGHRVARARTHALKGQLAYGPVVDWLRSDPIKSTLVQLDTAWLAEIARLLPELLSDYPELPAPKPLTGSWQRRQIFEALCNAFTLVNAPLLLILDDLQWCDLDTLAWLQFFLECVQIPLLVVGTLRSDELETDHPWRHLQQQLQRQDRLTTIQLAPLTHQATADLARQVKQTAFEAGLIERLFQDTGGNPLFVIESASVALENFVPNSEETDQVDAYRLPIPPKMYSVIQARLASN